MLMRAVILVIICSIFVLNTGYLFLEIAWSIAALRSCMVQSP